MISFTISYTPVEYGNVKSGRLIIQTADYYWNIAVEGTFPKYEVPAIKSKLAQEVLGKKSQVEPPGKNKSGLGSKLEANAKPKR